MKSEESKKIFLWILVLVFLAVAIYLIVGHLVGQPADGLPAVTARPSFHGPTTSPYTKGPVGLPPGE
ncbi:MAG TPA: hypothetical protein VMU70_02470 [Candidatus Tyrphobacter sp.]|nr:hypothetical protein [Candidatus Tyrphobacter sp.]